MGDLTSCEFPFGDITSAKDQLIFNKLSDADCHLGSSEVRLWPLGKQARQLCNNRGCGGGGGGAYVQISPPGEN